MTAARQLDGFIAKFSPEIAARTRAIVRAVEKRLPGANRLVYDNYNALAIGFGPNERASDIVLSVAVYPRWVSMFFMGGPSLPDPTKILRGSGTMVRHVVLASEKAVSDPAIAALITAALARADPPIDPRADGRVIVKSISAKQRPRRPAPTKKPATTKKPTKTTKTTKTKKAKR